MGKIRVGMTVNAPLEHVYSVARALEEYPSFMSSLKKIEILDRDECGDNVRARWHAEAKLVLTKRKMCWVQKDAWDNEEMVCCSTVDPREPGQYKHFDAKWYFKPHPKGTEMNIVVDYQLDHPLMTPAIHKIIDVIMEKNNRSLLESIKRRAESTCPQ